MLNLRKEFLKATFAVACLAIASTAALADDSENPAINPVKNIDTKILKVRKPIKEGGLYTVMSTRDGRNYFVDSKSTDLIAKLESVQNLATGVHLQIVDDNITAVTVMTEAENKEYTDATSGMSAEELANQAGVADGTEEVVLAETSRNESVEVAGIQARAAEAFAAVAPVMPESAAEYAHNYSPTVVKSMAEAQRLFNSLRDVDSEDTQCHERAMYWTYHLNQSNGINSMKVMMFYTPLMQNIFVKYKTIGANKPYKWWYHTAPMIYVNDNGTIKEVVLDRSFLAEHGGAVELKDWTRYFISDMALQWVNPKHHYAMPQLDGSCKVMKNYREFRLEQEWFSYREGQQADYINKEDGFVDEVRRRLNVHGHGPSSNYYTPAADKYAETWCMVRKYPMFYMQPDSVLAMDCDPSRDPADRYENSWIKNFDCRIGNAGSTPTCRAYRARIGEAAYAANPVIAKAPKVACVPNKRAMTFDDSSARNDVISAFSHITSETSGMSDAELKWARRSLGYRD